MDLSNALNNSGKSQKNCEKQRISGLDEHRGRETTGAGARLVASAAAPQ
jgi:hypothetical protein